MILQLLAFIVVAAVAVYVHCKYAGPKQTYQFKGLDGDAYYELNVNQPQRKPQPKQRKILPSSKVGKKKWKYEEECRRIVEEIYQCSFPSVRPAFLKNPVTNKNLELDCYNEKLKIAVEYDGSQHARYNPHFHRGDKWKFIYQVKKDDWKNLMCEKEGVTLIRIPHYIPFEKLEPYIKKKLQKVNKL